MNFRDLYLEKVADVSKEELREELKKHEERETPKQEKEESEEEQKVEREAGVEHEKKAFISGFAKQAGKHMPKGALHGLGKHMKKHHGSYLQGLIATGSLGTAYGANKKHKKESK